VVDVAAALHRHGDLARDLLLDERRVLVRHGADVDAAHEGNAVAVVLLELNQVVPGLDLQGLDDIEAGLEQGGHELHRVAAGVEDHGQTMALEAVGHELVSGLEHLAVHGGREEAAVLVAEVVEDPPGIGDEAAPHHLLGDGDAELGIGEEHVGDPAGVLNHGHEQAIRSDHVAHLGEAGPEADEEEQALGLGVVVGRLEAVPVDALIVVGHSGLVLFPEGTSGDAKVNQFRGRLVGLPRLPRVAVTGGAYDVLVGLLHHLRGQLE